MNTLIHTLLLKAILNSNRKILVFAPSYSTLTNFFEEILSEIDKNPSLKNLLEARGNFRQPYWKLTFKQGSIVSGFILNDCDSNSSPRCGLTADYVFLLQSEQFSENALKTIRPIMQGDKFRKDKVETFTDSKPFNFSLNQYQRDNLLAALEAILYGTGIAEDICHIQYNPVGCLNSGYWLGEIVFMLTGEAKYKHVGTERSETFNPNYTAEQLIHSQLLYNETVYGDKVVMYKRKSQFEKDRFTNPKHKQFDAAFKTPNPFNHE